MEISAVSNIFTASIATAASMEISELVNILTAVIALAASVAAITPTPKDDGIVKNIYKLLEILALNIGKAKDK